MDTVGGGGGPKWKNGSSADTQQRSGCRGNSIDADELRARRPRACANFTAVSVAAILIPVSQTLENDTELHNDRKHLSTMCNVVFLASFTPLAVLLLDSKQKAT